MASIFANRVALLLPVLIVGVACETPETVRVALRVDVVRTDRPTSYMIPGDWLALVARPSNGPPVTIVAVPAKGAVAAFRQAVDARRLPAMSPVVEIPLPAKSQAPRLDPAVPIDIVFFADRNQNRQWDDGEPFASSWTGGRGGYRVTFPISGSSGSRGAANGWTLIEGGVPPVSHSRPASVLVYIYPVMEPVEK